jgi:hypothetical protein
VATPRIKSTAVLIGYNPQGRCVYSDILHLSDYYEGEHVWDNAASVKRLKLQRVKGYLFDGDGNLNQEFESVFELSTGIFRSGRTRYADGTEQVDPPDAEPSTAADGGG